jgi:hypothetical protein
MGDSDPEDSVGIAGDGEDVDDSEGEGGTSKWWYTHTGRLRNVMKLVSHLPPTKILKTLANSNGVAEGWWVSYVTLMHYDEDNHVTYSGLDRKELFERAYASDIDDEIEDTDITTDTDTNDDDELEEDAVVFPVDNVLQITQKRLLKGGKINEHRKKWYIHMALFCSLLILLVL